MQYFIPAWYQDGDWKENEQIWYRPRTVTEFDDTVKQIQLFTRNHVAPFEILLLGFSPNFRHYLHRQGVYHAPYWSCFDAMQAIRTDSIDVFSYHDLAWPEDVEFVYSPFAVIAKIHGQKYAQIEFAEDGNMFRVDMFKDGQLADRNFYDDRGFVSCRILYRGGPPYLEQYFDDEGEWKLARFLEDGHVLINPESSFYLIRYRGKEEKLDYSRQRYDSIEEVIEEVLGSFLRRTTAEDIFTVAMHPLHTNLLIRALKGRKKILSFFNRRVGADWTACNANELVISSDYIVVDNKESQDRVIRESGRDDLRIKVITPYDSRVEFGVSQHLRVQNVLVAVDQIPDELFNEMVVVLAKYAEERNSHARIRLFTRKADFNEGRRLLVRTQEALQAAGMDIDLAREEHGTAESRIDENMKKQIIFSVAQCVDEMAVSRTLREQRIVVDLQEVPDQFLEISAMSMGVPQITLRETSYVLDGKNGIVIEKAEELPDCLDYYLASLANWNTAQIASYEIGNQFSTGKLVEAWKEVISYVEDQGTAARRE